jgi:hypothetical protein
MAADRQQVPDSEKGSRKEHEAHARADVQHQDAGQRSLTRGSDVNDLARLQPPACFPLDARWKGGHRRSVHLTHRLFSLATLNVEFPFNPVFPEQLNWVLSSDSSISAAKVISGAQLLAAPANTLRVFWIQRYLDLSHT